MRRRIVILIALTVLPYMVGIHAAVKEKTFYKYEDQLPLEMQKDINNTKKIGKIVEDIIYNGDLDQLYWLSREWSGLDISTINNISIYDYYGWCRRLICYIIQKDSTFIPIHDGRNVFGTFYSSFYPRSDTRTTVIEMAEMLKVLNGFRKKQQLLQTFSEPALTYARSVFEEESNIQIHFVERMLFGSDRYSCAHISPAPDDSITSPIAELLGREVLSDPTLLPECVAALTEDKDSALLAISDKILIYNAYYVSSYDQNTILYHFRLAANRQGELDQIIEKLFAILKQLYPSQYKLQFENMEGLKSNAVGSSQMLEDFVSYQDSLRRNGFMFVDYPLQTIPVEWQESDECITYLERYLRLGYVLCKEIMQGNGYNYILNQAANIRSLLKTMGYYHHSLSENYTWQNRLTLYICDLNEATRNWYYYSHDSWAIGAVMADYAVLRELVHYHYGDQMYMQLINTASFFLTVLNNNDAAKSILEEYIFPVLPDANIVSRDKEWNCHYMWFYASVLPYFYQLYEGETMAEYGKFYSDRLLQAVRFNKRCENNAYALGTLAEYYYNVDSIDLGDRLLDEYFALTQDSMAYYGYRFAINYWIKHDYVSAAEAADIVNQYEPTSMGTWFNEGCLRPSRAYALAGREQEAHEQLTYFNDYMRKTIGKQLLSIGVEQASQLIKRYEAINDCFVMICEDSISSRVNDFYLQSFYDWQLQSKGLLLALNTQTDSILSTHPDSNIRDLYQRCKQREKALADIKDLNSEEAITMQLNLVRAKTNLQSAVQEYIDKNDFAGINQFEWSDVRNALKEHQVAIEIVNGKIGEDTVPVYYALLLRSDATAPVAIRLFGEEEVASLAISGSKEKINNTYSFTGKGQQLTHLIWDALMPYIAPGEVVFFSPSGILHQIAVENLPYDEKRTMADVYNMVRLSSTREIIGGRRYVAHQNAVLFGDIRYSATPNDLAFEHEKYRSQYNTATLAMASPQRMILRDKADDLPGTKIEVDSIEHMLKEKHMQVTAYRGSSATEESFKALSGQGNDILHLATHGFYWSEKEAHLQKYFSQNSTIENDIEQALPIDPLSRCGLLFAGANSALGGHSDRLKKGVQDGILTAKEISALDLRGADIVVLSACETGLGDVSGDGVFGLQRAFKIAGAQTILMALWKVDDDATRMLTTAFYRNYSKGQTKQEAFRNAQQEVRNYTKEETKTVTHTLPTTVGSNKEKYKNQGKSPATETYTTTETVTVQPYKDPYFWAGFVLLD